MNKKSEKLTQNITETWNNYVNTKSFIYIYLIYYIYLITFY